MIAQLVKIGFLNLVRHTRRSLITVLGIGLGFGLMMFSIMLAEGMYRQMLRTAIESMAGHVVVQAEGYNAEPDPKNALPDSTVIADALRAVGGAGFVTRRLSVGGMLVSSVNSVGVGLRGVEATEARTTDVDDKLVDGTWLDQAHDGRGGAPIVIGVQLADRLGAKVGTKLVFQGQTDADISSRLFRVAGIWRTGSPEIDGFVAFAPIEAVQEMWSIPDAATQVALHVDDANEAEALTERAEQALAGRPAGAKPLEVLSWREALPELLGFMRIDRVSNDVINALLGVMVAMGVLNTVLMSVLERVREFGVMLAVGMRPRWLAGMVLAEGALLGVVGAAVGVAIGFAITWPMLDGVDMSGLVGGESLDTAGVSISAIVTPAYNWTRIGAYVVAAIVFTTVAAVWPAWRVARMHPVEAMRRQQ